MELLQFLGDSPGSTLAPMLHPGLHRELGHDDMHHMGCVNNLNAHQDVAHSHWPILHRSGHLKKGQVMQVSFSAMRNVSELQLGQPPPLLSLLPPIPFQL